MKNRNGRDTQLAKPTPAVAGKWTDESLPLRIRKQLLRAELEEVQRQRAARKLPARNGDRPDGN